MGRLDHLDHHAARSSSGKTELDKRRGHRPRKTRSGAGRRPALTLADRLLATVLHHRHALPQVAVAALFSVRPETINRRIRDTRDLLDQAGHTIEPAATTTGHPRRPLRPRQDRGHHHPDTNHDSELMICKP